MALFALLGVLRGFPAAAYRRTPHRKPLCGLDQDKNSSFLDWTLKLVHYTSWMDYLVKVNKKNNPELLNPEPVNAYGFLGLILDESALKR